MGPPTKLRRLGPALLLAFHAQPMSAAEFQFRYNNRANADIFGAVIGGC